jgi:hypothetical protein
MCSTGEAATTDVNRPGRNRTCNPRFWSLRRFRAVVHQREQRDAFGVEQGGELLHRLFDGMLAPLVDNPAVAVWRHCGTARDRHSTCVCTTGPS